jgi:uncharacterized protein YuzE
VKVSYDKETDTLSIILGPGKLAESDEPRPSLVLDYDKAGCLVSLELLDASEPVQAPPSVEFALAAVEGADAGRWPPPSASSTWCPATTSSSRQLQQHAPHPAGPLALSAEDGTFSGLVVPAVMGRRIAGLE